MNRRKTYLIAGFIVALLCVEVIACMLGFGETVQVYLDDKIEYVLVENQDVTRFGNKIKINSLGHRSEEISEKKTENERRILLVGDSVVYGNHHVDQTETIAYFLSQSLNEQNPQDIYSVISAAASSWGPKNMLEYLKGRGLYQSDLVFLVLSSHDIFDFPSFDRAVIPYRVDKNVAATDDIIYAVYNRAKPWLLSKFSSGEKGMDFAEAQLKTNLIINEIIEFCKLHETDIVLVFHPSEQESNNDFLDVSYFQAIALENNIDFINLQPDYKNHNSFNLKKVHYDGLHLTPSGANLVAKIIKDKTKNKLEKISIQSTN